MDFLEVYIDLYLETQYRPSVIIAGSPLCASPINVNLRTVDLLCYHEQTNVWRHVHRHTWAVFVELFPWLLVLVDSSAYLVNQLMIVQT